MNNVKVLCDTLGARCYPHNLAAAETEGTVDLYSGNTQPEREDKSAWVTMGRKGPKIGEIDTVRLDMFLQREAVTADIDLLKIGEREEQHHATAQPPQYP